MVINVTDKEGRQIKPLLYASLDAELNSGDRDFALTIPLDDWDDRITAGGRIFIEGTEIGGVLGQQTIQSDVEEISFTGYTWRGRMERKIIVPPSGQDYYTVSGELNAILKELIEPRFGGVFLVPDISTGVTTTYQFERFENLLDGCTKMLKEKGHRLKIRYNMGEPNGTGWVEISAVPIVDYSDQIQLSQDSKLKFTMSEKQDGVNHLIVGGKGEMQDRNILHLYVQKDGTIGESKYYNGIDEIEYFYENTSTDTGDLKKKAIEELEKRMNSKTFEMDVEQLGIDVDIGDIIGGKDFRTGMEMKKPLENIVIKIQNGIVSKEYKLEGS